MEKGIDGCTFCVEKKTPTFHFGFPHGFEMDNPTSCFYIVTRFFLNKTSLSFIETCKVGQEKLKN